MVLALSQTAVPLRLAESYLFLVGCVEVSGSCYLICPQADALRNDHAGVTRGVLRGLPDLLDDAVQALEVDWFHEVREEAGVFGAREIFIHSVAA